MFHRHSRDRSLLVAGLGNPGPGYARTRHNVGAVLVEMLASRCGADLRRVRGQIRSGDCHLEGKSVALAIPTTFMNESGPPVARLLRKAGAKPESLLVVHDELDLPLGRVRLKSGGGTGGHRGLESIASSLRSRDFLRLRIGIGRPPVGVEPREFVLRPFTPDERPVLEKSMDAALEVLPLLVSKGLEAAQTRLHTAS
ncbi:MAG TPA: aminoacyl-tRNA hydrolase [Actinomycetota bacterium]|nr:aminoacyl-tRNA hydrolase [Actinomycetota bacterium]